MIKTIKLENFRSYRNETIELTSGINVLAGATGAGKTNIIIAIGAAMFGHLPRGKQLVLRGSKIASIEIVLDDAVIKRVFGSSSSWTVYSPDAFVIAEGVEDVSAWVKDYLGISSPASLKSAWDNALRVAQFGVIKGFDLSTSARRKYFDATMNVDKYEKIWTWLRGPLNALEGRATALVVEIARLEPVAGKLGDFQSLLLEIQQSLDDLKGEYQTVDLLLIPECKEKAQDAKTNVEAALDVVNKITTHNARVSSATRDLAARKASLPKYSAQVEKGRADLVSLNEAQEFLKKHDGDFNNMLHEIRSRISDANTKKGITLQQVIVVEEQVTLLSQDVCPACHQDISTAYAEELRDKLAVDATSLAGTLARLNRKIPDEQDNLFATSRLRDQVRDKKHIASIIGSRTVLHDKIRMIEEDISLCETAIEEIETTGLDKEIPSGSPEKALTAAGLTLSAQQKELADLRTKRAVLGAGTDAGRKEKSRLLGEIELSEEAAEEMAEKNTVLDQLRATIDLLTKIRQAIRSAGPEVAKRKVALVSRLANQMFADIWQHRGGSLEWLEDYSIHVELDGIEHGFDVSGGQSVLAAWCIRLALAQALGQAPLLVLDEATMGSVDPELMPVIPELVASCEVEQAIVVDHGGLFDAVASNVVSIYNNSGVSEVKG